MRTSFALWRGGGPRQGGAGRGGPSSRTRLPARQRRTRPRCAQRGDTMKEPWRLGASTARGRGGIFKRRENSGRPSSADAPRRRNSVLLHRAHPARGASNRSAQPAQPSRHCPRRGGRWRAGRRTGVVAAVGRRQPSSPPALSVPRPGGRRGGAGRASQPPRPRGPPLRTQLGAMEDAVILNNFLRAARRIDC